LELLGSVGKAPVHVRRDIPGFIGNRLQHALWREAFALVEAGVCGPEEIDRIVKDGFGVRLAVLGPMENADLVGLDLTRSIHEYLFPYLSSAGAPARMLTQLTDEGLLGMKTGKGLRTWPTERADEVRERLFEHLRRAHEARRASSSA
jgi:3-hydroxybutyryl-CoA dehydrogenase